MYRHIFNLIAVGGEVAASRLDSRAGVRSMREWVRLRGPASLIGNYQLSTNNSPNIHRLVFCMKRQTSSCILHLWPIFYLNI